MVALFVLTQAVVADLQVEKNEDKQEQKSSEDSESQQITETVAIASASSQLSFDHQSTFLGEIFIKDQDEDNQTSIKDVLHTSQKAIRVILRRIISPNAP